MKRTFWTLSSTLVSIVIMAGVGSGAATGTNGAAPGANGALNTPDGAMNNGSTGRLTEGAIKQNSSNTGTTDSSTQSDTETDLTVNKSANHSTTKTTSTTHKKHHRTTAPENSYETSHLNDGTTSGGRAPSTDDDSNTKQ